VCVLKRRALAKPLGFHFWTPYPLFKKNDPLQGKGLGRRFLLIRSLRAGSQWATTKWVCAIEFRIRCKTNTLPARLFHARFQLRLSIIKSTRQSFFVSSGCGPTKIGGLVARVSYAGFLIRKNAHPNAPAVVLLIWTPFRSSRSGRRRMTAAEWRDDKNKELE